MFDETVVDQAVEQDDVFFTGSIPVPPAESDAHLGTIESVSKNVFDSGATCIEIALKASDVPGLDTQKRLFMPKNFVADINCDKASLPESEGNNQKFQYRTSIANDDGTAEIQELLKIAKDNGRTPAALGLTKATDFDTYVANLSAMLTGLEVVFVRRAGKGEFKNRLEVRRIYGRSVLDNPGKKFKGVRLGWE